MTDTTPEVWALYKEVMTYYEAGLDPPPDVTLLFPDDNFGNVRRLPIGEEVDREGGCGVYFHLEYVGDPRAYKWANTNNLVSFTHRSCAESHTDSIAIFSPKSTKTCTIHTNVERGRSGSSTSATSSLWKSHSAS